MSVRTNSEIVDLLPKFEAQSSSDFDGWLKVWCPYEDCSSHEHEAFFLVLRKAWLAPRKYTTHAGKEFTVTGRSCPYCFRAARLPSGRGR